LPLSHSCGVCAPAPPAHGKSGKHDAPYTIDFYAGVIRSLGRELGVREAVVMGNSLGGQIALELALSYPVWTRALVLAAPAGGFSTALRAFGPLIGAGAHPALLRSILPRSLARSFYDSACPDYEARRAILAERL